MNPHKPQPTNPSRDTSLIAKSAAPIVRRFFCWMRSKRPPGGGNNHVKAMPDTRKQQLLRLVIFAIFLVMEVIETVLSFALKLWILK